MRLIDADALEEKLDKIPARRIGNADGRAYVLIRLSTVLEIIKQMPPAQPEERTKKRTETRACDLISRQAAIEAIQNEVEPFAIVEPGTTCVIGAGVKDADVIRTIEQLPPTQPEEAIPVSWIESRIERFKAEDNAFCGLTANIMHVMLNEWKREQEGETE